MGILQRIRSSLAPQTRLFAELAQIAGRNEILADRLHRHARLCPSPTVATALEQVADKQAAHARSLSTLLAQHGVAAKPPDVPLRDGANNWERVGADLQLLMEISRALSRQSIDWESLEPELAALLRGMAEHDDQDAVELRQLTVKLDPQALD
jgi:hypothetical protein